MFFVMMKILLDDIAFFTPFYYKEPIVTSKDEDVRGSKYPWSFRDMQSYFLKKKPDFDKEFANILFKNQPWTDEICDIRKFLVHRFHDLVIDHDFWTRSYFAFLYEFNTRKDFIPDVLPYVAKVYFKFVRFVKNYEDSFRKRCEREFQSYEYFAAGSSYAGTLDKTHLFFASLGRILNNRILIRVHPNRRDAVADRLEEIMGEEKITCSDCHSYKVRMRPTVEEFVLISVECGCGKTLALPFIAEKKFFPYFMDRNRRENFWGLIPYTLRN